MTVLPRRLIALEKHLAERDGVFGDWDISGEKPLTELNPDADQDLVAEAARPLHVFAGDFAGGSLVLDLLGGEAETAPVVSFDSEGGIDVLGTSLDDFLALITSDQPDAHETSWVVEPDLRDWIVSTGITPHSSAGARLDELAETTRLFRIRWQTALRESTRRLRPTEVIDHRLVLGECIGDFRLGMNRAELDERWGSPKIPPWARDADGVTAFYAKAPVVVKLDREERRVIGLKLYGGRHRARTDDGFDPLLLPQSDALAHLASRGLRAESQHMAIVVPDVRARFGLGSSQGGGHAQLWIDSIELSACDSRA